MTFRPVNPKAEVDRILQEIRYNDPDLVRQRSLFKKIEKILHKRQCNQLCDVFNYNFIYNKSGKRVVADNATSYKFNCRHFELLFYVVEEYDLIIFNISNCSHGTSLFKTMIFDDNEVYNSMKRLLEESLSYADHNVLDDVLDELLNEATDV